MINPIFRRYILNCRIRENIYFCINRKETTSLVKTRNDLQQEWERKMKFYMKTYEDLFGLTKLTEIHDRVIEIQTNLQAVQEKRRKVQEEIFIVQKKLQEMQDILHKTSMGDDMYLPVVTQVRELLKEQKRLQDIFSLYDQTEREQQTTLAMAINNSQDHEKTYREKNKYLSLITGVIGGILGLVGSSINNWRHRKDIKHFASDIFDQVDDLKKSVDKLTLVSSNGEVVLSASDQSTEIQKLSSMIKFQQTKLDESIKSLQLLLNNDNNDKSSNHLKYDGHKQESLIEFEKNIESKLNKHAYINLSLIGSCTLFFSLFMFYLTRSN